MEEGGTSGIPSVFSATVSLCVGLAKEDYVEALGRCGGSFVTFSTADTVGSTLNLSP